MGTNFLDLARKSTKDLAKGLDNAIHEYRQRHVLVTYARIRDKKQRSFRVTFQGKTIKTFSESSSLMATAEGLILSPFDLDILVNSYMLTSLVRYKKIGRIHITALPMEGNVSLDDILVDIEDARALSNILVRIMSQKSVDLRLCGVISLKPTAGWSRPPPKRYQYDKVVRLEGMGGPAVSISSAALVEEPGCWAIWNGFEKKTDGKLAVSLTLHVVNPSPIMIDLGRCSFAICTDSGKTKLPGISGGSRKPFALLEGELDVHAHEFEVPLAGWVDTSVWLGPGKAMLKGIGSLPALSHPYCPPELQPDWCKVVVSGIDTKIERMDILYGALGLSDAEDAEKTSVDWRVWNHRLWKHEKACG